MLLLSIRACGFPVRSINDHSSIHTEQHDSLWIVPDSRPNYMCKWASRLIRALSQTPTGATDSDTRNCNCNPAFHEKVFRRHHIYARYTRVRPRC
jgi:hypothetical protein